jgi:hypothetical protein
MNAPSAPAGLSRARAPIGRDGSIRVWTLLALVLTTACGSPPPRAPNPTRPLDERRAIELIFQAFREERDHPVPGRSMALSQSKQIRVDVMARGRKYGVAYVTASERLELGTSLPEKDPAMGDALQLVSGLGEDGDARVLVLRDTDYQYDDHVGDQHEQPSIAAELKLKRDVRDFIVRAHAEKWP